MIHDESYILYRASCILYLKITWVSENPVDLSINITDFTYSCVFPHSINYKWHEILAFTRCLGDSSKMLFYRFVISFPLYLPEPFSLVVIHFFIDFQSLHMF